MISHIILAKLHAQEYLFLSSIYKTTQSYCLTYQKINTDKHYFAGNQTELASCSLQASTPFRGVNNNGRKESTFTRHA